MRLLTHNYLQSNVKGTEKGYPLIVEATTVVVEESPVNAELLQKLLPKLDYAAVVQAAKQLSDPCQAAGIQLPELPETIENDMDEIVLANLHRVLFDLHVQEGHLICPDTGRKFPIKEGIPNMILHEDEI
jgi:multifunctional methyltransferase subunit TRM112